MYWFWKIDIGTVLVAEAAEGYAFKVLMQKALLVACWHMASMYFVAEAEAKRNGNKTARAKRPKQ